MCALFVIVTSSCALQAGMENTSGAGGGIILRGLCPSSTIYLHRRVHGHCSGTTYTAFGVNTGAGLPVAADTPDRCFFTPSVITHAWRVMHSEKYRLSCMWGHCRSLNCGSSSRALNVAQYGVGCCCQLQLSIVTWSQISFPPARRISSQPARAEIHSRSRVPLQSVLFNWDG